MITLQGKYKDGSVRIEKDPGLSENDQVYVIVMNKDRKSGIDPRRNALISEAKKDARKREKTRGLTYERRREVHRKTKEVES